MHPHTSSFSYRIAAAAARLGVLLTPRGLDDVLTASAVCFLALGFWLPIRHALIERHYFPSPPHFFSAVASSFSHTLATVPHRAGLPYFQTLARLPDVRAFSSRSRDISHFTVTLNHPPVARYLALHRRRSEWSTKAQFPISIAAYHLGTQPSLALRTHLCSDDRTYDLDFPPAAISGSQLGALHDPGVPGSNSSSIHPSPPCAHAPYWWKDGVPHEDSILLCRRGVQMQP